MPLKCVAIDDEPLALELLRQYIIKFPALKLVQTFDDAISGAEFLRDNSVDLLFVDINMPDITGIDLVKSLQQKPMVIFTTAYKKFAIDGFDLDAIDYLLKPVEFERFAKAVNKAVSYYGLKNTPKNGSDDSILVRSEYKLIRINLDNIEYIENVGDYIKIHLLHSKPVLTLMPLKTVLEKLPEERFRRIHRSYIVPLAKIRSIANRKVQLTNVSLPVSDSYVNWIDDWMKK